MSVYQLLRTLQARWRVIAIFVAIGFVLALVFAFASPRKYAAASQVVVNLRSPDAVEDEKVVDQIQPDYLMTQTDVIRSDRVGVAAAKRLGLASDPDAIAAYRAAKVQMPIANFLSNGLRKRLKVISSATSRVISIEYTSTDPLESAAAANAFADAYQAVSLEMQTDPAAQSTTWYAGQATRLREQIHQAQSALDAKRRQLGVPSSQEQTDPETGRLNSLAQQLAAAQAAGAATSSRASGGALPDAVANPVIQSLQSQLALARAERNRLSSYAGSQNEDLVQANARVNTLAAELASQRALVARSSAVAAGQSAASVRSLSAQLETQRQRTVQTSAARSEVALLEQDVANYKTLLEKLQTRIAQVGMLSLNNQTNVVVLARAVPPTSPQNPPRSLVLMLGMIAGLIFGMITAVALELLDRRIRSLADIDGLLGMQGLGAIRLSAPDQPAGLRRLLPGTMR